MVYFHVLSPATVPPPTGHDAVLGFGYADGPAYVVQPNRPRVHLGDSRSVFIPRRFTLAITAALPLWWIAPLVRRRLANIPAGHCRECGYDLRSSPERCPECGTAAG